MRLPLTWREPLGFLVGWATTAGLMHLQPWYVAGPLGAISTYAIVSESRMRSVKAQLRQIDREIAALILALRLGNMGRMSAEQEAALSKLMRDIEDREREYQSW